ncbi:MAG: histidine phosphotransferase ChpT [Brevundimonas sp.]|uniref:histidine phosphotransferase ChpT n=1 Tax=Brevundimonas sp. TaxID=1871086 RepID=UPI00391D0D94
MTTDSDAIMDGADLATFLTGKLCHDFISPAGAIASGLDLINDPSAQDMREEAMGLIAASSEKLIALIRFARVAYGAATTAERFSADDLKPLAESVFKGARASLDWRAEATEFSKPHARALLNLAQLTGAALPGGGTATVTAREADGWLTLRGEADGVRARLKPEAVTGLAGERLNEGLAGQWIQPYWLWRTVNDHGGSLGFTVGENRVTLTARMPL